MPSDYVLGLLTVPAVAGACGLLYTVGWLVNRLGRRLVLHIRPGTGWKRAEFSAVVACARRVWMIRLPADLTVTVTIGSAMGQFEEIRGAVYRVIGPAAPRVGVRADAKEHTDG